MPSIPPPLVSGVLFNLIFKVMNTKSKTYYDIVPTVLSPVVLLRFRSRKEANKYLDDNHLRDTWIVVPTRIDL